MLTQQGVGSDNAQCLLPEPGAASEHNRANPVSLRHLGSFDLTSENDELLPEQGVFCDQVKPAVCGI
jgi:hypothetical protein